MLVSKAIEVRKGCTFSCALAITLPTAAWTASVVLSDRAGRLATGDFGIACVVTVRQVNVLDPTKTDYLIALYADAAVTANWQVRPNDVAHLSGHIRFRDGAAPANVVSTRDFQIEVTG